MEERHEVTEEASGGEGGAVQVESEEAEHFRAVVDALLFYEQYMRNWLAKCEADLHAVPAAQRSVMPPGVMEKYRRVRELATVNQQFIHHMVADHANMFQNSQHHTSAVGQGKKAEQPTLFNMEKVKSTLCQFARDWSAEGKEERDACYGPLLAEIEERFTQNKAERVKVRILTPGAGLGRLTYELAARGFTSQGNEFSYYMLLGSNFILNRSTEVGQYELHPYLRQSCNVVRAADQLRVVRVPDVVASVGLNGADTLSMVAGDFIEVYGVPEQHGQWDCIATCFFLDTAHNVVDYVAVIANVLRSGGVWVNVGPLLWHYADMDAERSVEMAWDEVKQVIEACGFRVEKEGMRHCPYTANQASMLKVAYDCVFFVATKQAEPPAGIDPQPEQPQPPAQAQPQPPAQAQPQPQLLQQHGKKKRYRR
eukprot:TRINITY_DN711_c0_g1_i1.p1 TRINITY_DN711_c0_g1~~TRINITY_DN711_c0_g1_i1.p1  ORF type:complete len:434 (+),score=116.74 TRINITY_DN711_c0_g1_i1:30-1304(+)